MPRPQRCRRICALPEYTCFLPKDVTSEDAVVLSLDEFESLRLMDHQGCTHEHCAAIMQVSRTTVTEIYAAARRKLAEAIVCGRGLVIEGGSVRVCERAAACGRNGCLRPSEGSCGPGESRRDGIMKIAVTYEKGDVFQHFGHSRQFKIYEAENGKIVSAQVVDTDGSGHGALAGFLRDRGVDALICGGIGGAQAALREIGIQVYGGVSGGADEAAAALAGGELVFDPDVHCDHHGEHHHEGGRACGSQSCGGNCH